MVSHLFYYQLVLLGLLWLFVMLHVAWPSPGTMSPPRPAKPLKPRRQPSQASKPFAGLTQKPHCALCEHDAAHPHTPPPAPPEPMPPTHRRPRTVDTSRHFCPHVSCRYRGWLGLGNLRANGHPSGGPWRQFHCTACEGYFLETHGTIFHGKQAAVELIVRVLACLAEGLGIRATARVFEVDPNTVLSWLGEAAEQLRAFAAYFLCDLPRLGKFVEQLLAADGLHTGINISRICSHLWPRASRDAANRNSPSSASRAIARAFCPTVIAPCANANLSEADGDVDAR
jgi:hypothetical protein